MKQKLFTIALLMYGGYSLHAQNVNIPDPLFKAALLGNNEINTNGDAEISLAEAQAFTNVLDVGGMNISDLTGIEAFENVTEVHVHNNTLLTLNLSALPQLEVVWCYGNTNLSALNINGLSNLTTLYAFDCALTSIDVSTNDALSFILLSNNQLTSFVPNLSCSDPMLIVLVNNQLTQLDLSGVQNIGGLDCRDNELQSLNLANEGSNSWVALRTTGNTALTCIKVNSLAEAASIPTLEKDAFTSFDLNCEPLSIPLPSMNRRGLGEVTIFPNPASNSINLSSISGKPYTFILSDLSGKVLETHSVNLPMCEIPINHLSPGHFIGTIITENSIQKNSFIKE